VRLVIDANIAQSAGTSDVPISLHSRECLNAIRDNGHVAVFCEKLLEEWSEHSSSLSRRWWRSMAARRKIERREGIDFAQLLDPTCACLEHDSWKEDRARIFTSSNPLSPQTVQSSRMREIFPDSSQLHVAQFGNSLSFVSPTPDSRERVALTGSKPEPRKTMCTALNAG
jgi:hypothetical protein